MATNGAAEGVKPDFRAEFKEKPMKAIKRMISQGQLAEDPVGNQHARHIFVNGDSCKLALRFDEVAC
eukprot:1754163-Rhodomonas_salina.2